MVKIATSKELNFTTAPILLKCGRYIYSSDIGFISTATYSCVRLTSTPFRKIHSLSNYDDIVVAESESELWWIRVGEKTIETERIVPFDSKRLVPIGINFQGEVLFLSNSDNPVHRTQIVSMSIESDSSEKVLLELSEHEEVSEATQSPIENLLVSTSGNNVCDSIFDAGTGKLVYHSESIFHVSMRHQVVVTDRCVNQASSLFQNINARLFTAFADVDHNVAAIAVPRAITFSKFDGTVLGAEIFPSGSVLRLGMNGDYIALSGLFSDATKSKTVIVELESGQRRHVSNRVSRWLWTDAYALEVANSKIAFFAADYEELLTVDLRQPYTSVQASKNGEFLLFADQLGGNEGVAFLMRLRS